MQRAIILLATLLIGTILAQATCGVEPSCTTSGKANFECQSGDFVVQVTGNQNVPKYSFYLNSDAADVYKLQFSQMNELSAGQKTYSLSLSSLDWTFTTPAVVDTSSNCSSVETQFTMFTEDSKAPFDSLKLINHLAQSSNTSSIKFDVVIVNYQWQDESSDSLELSFTYSTDNSDDAKDADVDSSVSIATSTSAVSAVSSVSSVSSVSVATSASSDSNDSEDSDDSDTVEYASSTSYTLRTSFVVINPVAYGYVDINNPDVNQTVSVITSNSDKLGFIYSRFEGSLVHDPTIGIDKDAIQNGGSSSSNQDSSSASYGPAVCIALVVLGVFALF
jgi:hypothetical protein